MFNVSATLNVSRLLYNPGLCIPHLTLKSFDQIPIPIEIPNSKQQKIRGVVLDKDNCFAKDHDDKIWHEYSDTWKKLLEYYPKESVLIVSNSAGTNDDVDYTQAEKLEKDTGVVVLRHPTKKPGCSNEILEYFSKIGIESQEIAVVGDRLLTDVVMANMMQSWAVWLSSGVEESQKLFPKLERQIYQRLVTDRPESPLLPPSPLDKQHS